MSTKVPLTANDSKISKFLLSALKFTNAYVPKVMSCKIQCSSSLFVVNLLASDGFLV